MTNFENIVVQLRALWCWIWSELVVDHCVVVITCRGRREI